MTAELVFGNGRIVTPDAVVRGLVRVRDGSILDVVEDRTVPPGAIDLDGDYLMPGFVELHTDNLERHFSPRPGVRWPAEPAVVAHDAQVAAAGITTVFDALAAGDVKEDSERLRNLSVMTDAIATVQSQGLLRAEHRLHLRCEISYPGVLDIFQPLADSGLVDLVSLMDHTPGQRQFADLGTYRLYYQAKHGFSDTEMERFIVEKLAQQKQWSRPNRAALLAQCRTRGMMLASHDDATAEHVAESAADGVVVAEFPTTLEAAEACRRHGLNIMTGAPNLVRGGSHAGNVSALDLARRGLVDVLSSDYVPGSLLQSIFKLAGPENAIALPQAVAMVSRNPAEAVGLDDRGAILPGRRADLVRVAARGSLPVVRSVWRGGERVC